MKIFQKMIKELTFKNKNNEPLYNISTPKNVETNFNNNFLTNHNNNNEKTNNNIYYNKKYTKTEANLTQTKTNNQLKNKKNQNLKLYETSSKYIKTIINTNQNNPFYSSKKRSPNKTSTRKNRINFSKTLQSNEMQLSNRNKATKRINKSTKSLKMKYISNMDKNDISDTSMNKDDNKYSIKVNQFSKYVRTIYNTNRGNDFKSKNYNDINKKIYSYFNKFRQKIQKNQNHINQNKYTKNVPKYINEYQIKKMITENENEKEPLNLNNIPYSNDASLNKRKKSHNKISIKNTMFNNKNINNRISNYCNNINFNYPKTHINYNLTMSNQELVKKQKRNDINKNLSKKSSYHSSGTKNQNDNFNNRNDILSRKSNNNYLKNKFRNSNLEIPTEICFNSNNNEYKNTNSKNVQTNHNDINNNKIVINLNILKPKIFVDKYKNNNIKKNKNYSSNYRNNINIVQKKNKSKNYNTKKEHQFSFIETFLNNMINNKMSAKEKKY